MASLDDVNLVRACLMVTYKVFKKNFQMKNILSNHKMRIDSFTACKKQKILRQIQCQLI
jgi:hypothetical protein